MALVKYDTTNVDNTKRGAATVRIHQKGVFSFSDGAVRMLGYEPGTKIEFLHDEESGDWYVIKGENGFDLRLQSDKSKVLLANCAAIAQKILSATPNEPKSALYKISNEPQEIEGEDHNAWCVIIASGK